MLSITRNVNFDSSLTEGINIILLTDFVEVEWIFSGYGAVESGLQVRGPVVVKYIFSTCVLLTHPSYTRKYALTAIDVLDGGFTEEKENVLADVIGPYEVGFYEIKKNCLT